MKKNNNDTNRDSYGTPRNRSKTWDVKKGRDKDIKKDRKLSKKNLQNINRNDGETSFL